MPTETQKLLDPDFLKRLEQLQLTSRRILQGRMKGERRSKRKGVSIDFADYRDYVRGDDLRFIDWNIYSRLDRLFLKLFLEEQDLYFYIVLDTSKSMEFGDPAKLFYAKQIAAALSYIGLTHQDKVGITTFAAGQREVFTPARGRAKIWQMLSFLENLQADGRTSLTQTCREFIMKNLTRGIVILISDFFDEAGFESALKYFLQGNHEVFVLHVLDRKELEPETQGHLELVDIELEKLPKAQNEGRIEITITPQLLKQYRETVSAFCTQINDYCTHYGMNYLVAATDHPFDHIILRYLRQRGLLK